MKLLLVLALAATAVRADAESLKSLVRNSLEASIETAVDAEGVNNCENKCQNLLGYLNYYTAQQQQTMTGGNNEYRACVIGCNTCSSQLADTTGTMAPSYCFDYCKNYNSGTAPGGVIEKGIIEPDKACIIGCVIQLCQGLCTGPATWSGDNQPASGGCQIQSGYGVQTYTVSNQGNNYNPTCCNLLQNMCTYPNSKNKEKNPNYQSIKRQAYAGCPVGKYSDTYICQNLYAQGCPSSPIATPSPTN